MTNEEACSFNCLPGYGLHGLHTPADLSSTISCLPNGVDLPAFENKSCVDIDESAQAPGDSVMHAEREIVFCTQFAPSNPLA